MFYSIIADSLVVIHFAFIIFVVFGGLLIFKWRWLIYFQLTAAIWGILIEFLGWGCPLTPLENHFRDLAGSADYSEGFIDHYIIPIVYPAGISPVIQFSLGFLVIVFNLVIYGFVIRKIRKNT